MLYKCINSIRQFYLNNHIILIDDSTEKYDLASLFSNDKCIHIIKSYIKGSADQQLFKVLSETLLFDKALFIQDSMILNKKLENIDETQFKFIWHFTNHRVHWDTVKEPRTEYNIKNNIISHTDLVKHNILRDYNDNKEFQNFCMEKLYKKNEWVGCFGNLCVLDKKTLNILDNKVKFIERFMKSVTNRNRRVNESIFSLICHYCFPTKNFEDSYDGLHFDGYNTNKYANTPTGFNNLYWCSVRDYFSKVSFNR